jgi:hypothetical protein
MIIKKIKVSAPKTFDATGNIIKSESGKSAKHKD